jgi:hypothetical protein
LWELCVSGFLLNVKKCGERLPGSRREGRKYVCMRNSVSEQEGCVIDAHTHV